MNARRLWELQQIDLELESKRAELERIRSELKESDLLLAARVRLAEDKERLAALEKQQRELDAEVDDLREKLKRLNEKLYDGKIKNPKELMGFEQEAKLVAATVKTKEDSLLDLMSEIEKYQARLADDVKGLEEVEAGWRKDQESLRQQETIVTFQLDDLEKQRATAAANLSPDMLELYRAARLTKGAAVVKIDRGRCQGCRISLSIAELQRARTGTVVRCSNCGRILYLE
ncbi:MAG: C4-type zinc ribbon domain-containing protein [Chloroflexota bacterium]